MCNPLKPIENLAKASLKPVQAILGEITGTTAMEKEARRTREATEKARAEQEAQAAADLKDQKQLVAEKEAYERDKKKRRSTRMSTQGGGLSTKYRSSNLGDTRDTLG
jgi:hypothetical protein